MEAGTDDAGAGRSGARPGGPLDRRDFLKRAGAVGAVVWTAPAIQSVSFSGARAGSPPHPTTIPTTPTTQAHNPATTSSATTTTRPTAVLGETLLKGESDHKGQLPFTGAEIASLAVAGGAALAAGTAIVLANGPNETQPEPWQPPREA